MSSDSLIWVHTATSTQVSSGNGTAALGMTDYKFYCFNGEPHYLYVSQGLENHETARISFLDVDEWVFASFGRSDYAPFEELPPKPACYDEMLELARKLATDIPFVRVDLFEYEGRPRFSELTFHPCSGFMPFDPPEWDEKLGAWINLSKASHYEAQEYEELF